jgi:hypothetical protein
MERTPPAIDFAEDQVPPQITMATARSAKRSGDGAAAEMARELRI